TCFPSTMKWTNSYRSFGLKTKRSTGLKTIEHKHSPWPRSCCWPPVPAWCCCAAAPSKARAAFPAVFFVVAGIALSKLADTGRFCWI
ncbi:MAG: hypothetical protein E7K39_08450, partial [Bifidobacterium bifidum]|nr:hypothetical protein [Bifidobacterium bifidum]